MYSSVAQSFWNFAQSTTNTPVFFNSEKQNNNDGNDNSNDNENDINDNDNSNR